MYSVHSESGYYKQFTHWKLAVKNLHKCYRGKIQKYIHQEHIPSLPFIGTEKKMAVKSIAQHKEYIYTSDTHDIAIMELSSPVVFTDDINPICLPSTGERLPTGSICYLTGTCNSV